MANIGFISLGCAKNQVDCERMMYRVQEAGHTVKSDVVGSDVVVINTCGFIDSAKSEAIDYILQTAALKAEGLVGKILVTGCLSQRYQGDILKEMPEVDGILGTGSYTEIVPAIEKLLNGEQVVDFGSIDAPEVETGRIMTTAGHYAFIKIAEGCDNHCSYCVIPSLRGKYRSRQMDDVLYEARMLADSGVKELIVVAQDTSRYGTDLPGHKRLLPELLRKLCEIDGLHWIRVHYVYPDEIDDEFIQVMASEPKIVKYLDIPIQHCNSKILKLMNRRGDGEFLKALFARLRAGIPGLVIRTSLITGLPGEGEEEFAELCDFLREERSGARRRVRVLAGGRHPCRADGARGHGHRRQAGGDRGNAAIGDHGRLQRRKAGQDHGGSGGRLRRGKRAVLRPHFCRLPGHRRPGLDCVRRACSRGRFCHGKN